MKKFGLLFGFVVLLQFTSCINRDRVVICSRDEKQCITVITYDSGIRYVMNGKHFNVPDTNYIKLDMSQINLISDCLWGCWEDDDYKWQITIDKAIVLENHLDTTLFKFRARLPRNKSGIPTEIKFTKKNCFIYVFPWEKISPSYGDAIIK